MKKAWLILALILAVVAVCISLGYSNRYFATGMLTTCHGNKASMEFGTFWGTYNFKLRTEEAAEHTIDCTASLAEGEMEVYIATDGKQELLFTVKAGEAYEETILLDDQYDGEENIRIVVKTNGKCKNGKLALTCH